MPNVLKNDFTEKYSYRVVVIHCFGAAAITLLEPEDIAFWYGGKGGLFIADAVGPVSRVRKTVSVFIGHTNHVMFTIALTRKVTHHRTEYCFNSSTYLLRTHTGP